MPYWQLESFTLDRIYFSRISYALSILIKLSVQTFLAVGKIQHRCFWLHSWVCFSEDLEASLFCWLIWTNFFSSAMKYCLVFYCNFVCTKFNFQCHSEHSQMQAGGLAQWLACLTSTRQRKPRIPFAAPHPIPSSVTERLHGSHPPQQHPLLRCGSRGRLLKPLEYLTPLPVMSQMDEWRGEKGKLGVY